MLGRLTDSFGKYKRRSKIVVIQHLDVDSYYVFYDDQSCLKCVFPTPSLSTTEHRFLNDVDTDEFFHLSAFTLLRVYIIIMEVELPEIFCFSFRLYIISRAQCLPAAIKSAVFVECVEIGIHFAHFMTIFKKNFCAGSSFCSQCNREWNECVHVVICKI